MMISRAGIGRATRWRCHERLGAGGQWKAICHAAAFAGLTPNEIREAILQRLGFFEALPHLARQEGVPDEVVDRAIARAPALATEIEADIGKGV